MTWFETFADRIINISNRRPPDFVVGGRESPYLRGWYLIPRNPLLNIYLHQFLRSDDDRALHDHPWVNCSILLRGSYKEITPRGPFYRFAGDIAVRTAKTAHRIQMMPHLDLENNEWHMRGETPCWTLFITGPRIRQWGFHCPQGFVHWKDFTAAEDSGSIGKGCNQ